MQVRQVTKHADIPQCLYIGKVADVPVVVQRQVPQVPTVRKTGRVPQVQFKVIAVPIVIQRQVPHVQTLVISQINQVTKHVAIPQTSYIKGPVMPVVNQRQAPRPSLNRATKHVEFPQIHYTYKVVAVPTVIQRLVPQLHTVAKTVEVPPLPFSGRRVVQRQVPQIRDPRRGRMRHGFRAGVSVNGLLQVTMKLRCRRATHAVCPRPSRRHRLRHHMCRPGMRPMRSRSRYCRAVVSVNRLTQVTMILRCRRATFAFRQRPLGNPVLR